MLALAPEKNSKIRVTAWETKNMTEMHARGSLEASCGAANTVGKTYINPHPKTGEI